MFGFGKNNAAKNKISRSTEQVLELEAMKKSLEMEKEQIALELANLKLKEEMKLESETHKHKLSLESERAVFNREKEIWAKEKKEIVDRAAREKSEFESTLTKQLELKTNEAITLTKLEAQQKIKQAELDKERELTKLSSVHAKEVAELQASESEKYYNKLTEAFQEIQMHGDKNSKFVQELALKVFDKVPMARTEVGIDINAPKQLSAVKE